jgi:hypothetical protein
MTDIWDDPELKVTDEYVKFENVGDTVTGTVLGISVHRWDDGSTCPQLLLDVDGDEINLTAGQTRLKRALAEQRPQVGDTITATFTEEEKRPGGKTLKHFELTVQRGDGKATKAEPKEDPLASLTPEQRAAVEALGIGKPQF